MSYAKRVREIVIETLIGVVLVSAFVAYLFVSPTKGQNINWRLVAIIVNTLIVFGFLVSWFRHTWRNAFFWAAFTILLLGHLAIYAIILGRIQHLPFVYYAVLNVIELAVFTRILRRLSPDGSNEK
jgi:hypothetical protein